MKMRLLLLLVLMGSTLKTFAQNIQQFSYSLNNTYSHVENALLSKQLLADPYVNYRFLLIASISYQDDPLIVKDITINQRTSVLVTNYTTLNFGVGFHIAKNFLIGFRSGFTKASLNDFNVTTFQLTGTEDEESALTDTMVMAKWRLTSEESKFAFALIPKITLPTGSERSFTTDNSMGYGIDLAFETILADTVQIAANVGFHNSPDAFFSPLGTNILALDYSEKVLTSIGAYIPFTDTFGANIEFSRYWMLSSEDDQNPNELYGGLRYQAAQPLALFVGASTGNLDNSKDSNDFKITAGLKFHGGGYGPAKEKVAIAPLEAVDDFVVVPYGQSAIIDALQNDLVPQPALGYLRIVSNTHPQETKCEIVKTPLSVKYSQIKHFIGTSVCRYEYCTSTGICDEANINITVNAPQKLAAPAPEPYGNLVWNKSIYFCNDCDFLNARSIEITKELRDYIALKKGKIAKIVIEGHTSLVASKEYNLALSKRRSRNTYKQLRQLGIPAELMTMVAYGESRPEIKSFETHKKHPTNRRVEFRIYERVEN